ncbi:citramalate synthase [Oceanidesulfovibrio marinus]|uniref:Citramalate synthase n=1 Tax=Oceanidesulfovibrio marinus TaxID=370038 RepID=A0A6P1ZJG8_9BACT|nr:citramalate synthase [Oceanidesulfovibrio marinus]TVM35752.1 citramalate synthase [Oceanidesulfovibrio marinus]
MRMIEIYDTTLRDGVQDVEIHLSLTDKMRVAKSLDELGVQYIEGGWPGSNPTDKQFFKEMRSYDLKYSRLAAFGSTHNPKHKAENDANLKALIEARPAVATIFGKSWDLHVTDALRIPLERNLEIIRDSVAFLKPHFEDVFFDAEHFFDGFRENRDYALSSLKAAHEAGAGVLVLCDTNGGTLPSDLREIFDVVRKELPEARLGIHTHNDSDMAVANSIVAVKSGASQVQGTINGYGERCGNANLCSVIPALELKCDGKFQCLPEGKLTHLTTVSQFVAEIANLRPFLRQPYVGRSAFAHKGGIHVSAIQRNRRTYEHIEPEAVGNEQRILISDLSGRSNILEKAKKLGYKLEREDALVGDLLAEIKDRENRGYEYSSAEASFELLFYRVMGWSKRYFTPINFRVTDALLQGEEVMSEATVMVKVRGQVEHTASTGEGPVNAMDRALRKAVERFYPCISEVRLTDFKVRVLSGTTQGSPGTASHVRVLIESADKNSRWSTVGVSHNIIFASWNALVDSLTYKLFKDDPRKWPNHKP